MRRLVCTGLLLLATVSFGAPKKKKPPPPPPPVAKACESFGACAAELNDAFEAGDFERAQRLASRAESLAGSPKEKAQVLVLRGALDFQSAAPGDNVKDAVRAKFAEAIRLDAEVSVVSIPAFARTDALEALLIEARPKLDAPTKDPEPPPTPPTLLLTTEPAPQRRFPVVGTIVGVVSVGSLVAGGVMRGIAGSTYEKANARETFGDEIPDLVSQARTAGFVSTGLWVGAGVTAALAIVLLLLER